MKKLKLKNVVLLLIVILVFSMTGSSFAVEFLSIPSDSQHIVSAVEFGADANTLFYSAKDSTDSYGIYKKDLLSGDTALILSGNNAHIENVSNLSYGYYDDITMDTYILFIGRTIGRHGYNLNVYRVKDDGSESQFVLGPSMLLPELHLYYQELNIESFHYAPSLDTFVFVQGAGTALSVQRYILMKYSPALYDICAIAGDNMLRSGGYSSGYYTHIFFQPRLSPDGDKIAFAAMEWEPTIDIHFLTWMTTLKKSRIYVIEGVKNIVKNGFQYRVKNWSDTRITCITWQSDNFCWEPVWAPDGSALYWSEDVSGNFDFRQYCENNDDSGQNAYAYGQLAISDFNIYKRDFIIASDTWATDSVPIYTTPGVNEYHYALSDDGSQEACVWDDHTLVKGFSQAVGVTQPNNPPDIPSSISVNGSPAQGQTITDSYPTISWTYSDPDVDPQSKFEIQLSQNPDLDNPLNRINISENSSETNYVQQITTGGIWYIRVRVWDGIDSSGWSDGSDSFIYDDGISLSITAAASAAPDPFNPWYYEETALKFNLSEPAYVTVKIFDAGVDIRTIIQDKYMTTGDKVIYWDGKDDAGDTQSANGTGYDADISGTDILSTTSNATISSINIRESKYVIFINYDSPDPFYPDAPQISNINYRVDGPPPQVKVNIDIFDIYNNLVINLLDANKLVSFDWNQIWDGTNDGGGSAPDGVYEYRIDAGPQGQDKATQKTGVVQLIRNNTNYISDTSTDNQTIIELHSDTPNITASEVDPVSAETATLAIYQSGYVLIGSIFDLEPDGETFTDSAVIIFNYTPTTWLDETKLDIYKYDDALDTWLALNGIADADNNKIYAQINHLSLYAVLMKTPRFESNVIPTTVKITPQQIKTNAGVFTAYITIPDNLDRNLIDEDEIYINDKKALDWNAADPFLIAKFHRQDFDDYPKKEFILLPVTVKLTNGKELKGIDLVIFK